MITTVLEAYTLLVRMEKPYRKCIIEVKDNFFREDILERYEDICKQSGLKSVAVEAASLLSPFHDIVGGVSLFSEEKLWLVTQTNRLKGKKIDRFAEVVQKSDDFFIFLESATIPKALFAFSDKAIVLPAIKPWERPPLIINWIQAYCKKRKKVIDKDAAELLALSCSDSYHQMVQELEKLITYCWEASQITRKDVESIATIHQQTTTWQLLDALLQQNRQNLVLSLENIGDMHSIVLVRFIKNQLQRLVLAIQCSERLPSKTQEKRAALVRKLSLKTVIGWINRLELEDIAIRSGTDQSNGLSLWLSFCIKIK